VPPGVVESRTENIGKYKLTSNNAIVETATGKMPRFIKGIPFPDIKMSDPAAGSKIMWNTFYIRNANGPLNVKIDLKFIGRKTGYERSLAVNYLNKPYDGYLPAQDWSNPDNFESVNTILVTSPFDMAGTGMMQWRYRTEKEDMLFGYVPAIRRVRRMTPAGRSDALFGSDFARDDAGYGLYDGSVNTFKWRVIGEGETLAGFIGGNKPITIVQNKVGEWVFDIKKKGHVTWSYEKKGGSSAPWFVDSALYVKRPVWIVEGIPKDPYYNYGRQIQYIDKELFFGYWKVIYDRSKKYWKTGIGHFAMGQDASKTVSWNSNCFVSILDERAKHFASVDITENYLCNANNDANMFSLAGFSAMCK
jgi:hypothetical protein